MDPEAKSIQCVRHMRIKHIITFNAVVLVAALASSCSKSQSVSPKVTISLDRGTNMTTVTTNGYTFMIGKTVTNDAKGPKPSP